jgi:hypothetical protein
MEWAQDIIMEDMRMVRPVVETGYENMLLVRALFEKLHTPAELLATWGTTHLELMQRWGLDRATMVELFGQCVAHRLTLLALLHLSPAAPPLGWGCVPHTLDRQPSLREHGGGVRRTRDEWIKTDFDGWLAPNVFYPGVVDATQAALASPSCDTYIVTTKQVWLDGRERESSRCTIT